MKPSELHRAKRLIEEIEKTHRQIGVSRMYMHRYSGGTKTQIGHAKRLEERQERFFALTAALRQLLTQLPQELP